ALAKLRIRTGLIRASRVDAMVALRSDPGLIERLEQRIDLYRLGKERVEPGGSRGRYVLFAAVAGQRDEMQGRILVARSKRPRQLEPIHVRPTDVEHRARRAQPLRHGAR